MKLITTKDHLLLIDEEAETCKYYLHNSIDGRHQIYSYKGNEDNFKKGQPIKWCSKIIAHRPRTEEAKKLDLLWLPNPFEKEIDIEKLAQEVYREYPTNPKDKPDWTYNRDIHVHKKRKAFIKGYKAAQSSNKQFSLEDVRKAIKMAKGLDIKSGVWFKYDTFSEEEIIQSLSTQRLPKEFIVEYKKGFRKNSDGEEIGFPVHKTVELKTITNSEGKEELVGTYKY